MLGYLPIPPRMRVGMSLPIVRILASLGVGWIVGAMSNEKNGSEAAAGGIIVTLYQLIRPWTARNTGIRMMRYVPMGRRMRNVRGMGSIPRAMTTPRNVRMGRVGLKAMPGPVRRVRRMGAFVSPARTGGGITPAMMRYISSGPR